MKVGDAIVVEGADVEQFEVASEICRKINLPPPEKKPPVLLKKLFTS